MGCIEDMKLKPDMHDMHIACLLTFIERNTIGSLHRMPKILARLSELPHPLNSPLYLSQIGKEVLSFTVNQIVHVQMDCKGHVYLCKCHFWTSEGVFYSCSYVPIHLCLQK